MAITASWDGAQILWNLVTGKEIKRFKGIDNAKIKSITVTPDGKKVIAIYNKETYLNYPSCVIWDLKTGEAIKKSFKHNVAGGDLVVTADGKNAISSSENNTCIIWDLETGIWDLGFLLRIVTTEIIHVCF